MIRYALRWLWTLFGLAELPCRARRCGRPTVGVAVYCRKHTDAILERRP